MIAFCLHNGMLTDKTLSKRINVMNSYGKFDLIEMGKPDLEVVNKNKRTYHIMDFCNSDRS